MKRIGVVLWLILVLFHRSSDGSSCHRASQTTISGSAAKHGRICPNELIFEDNFDHLNTNNWKLESTLSGGGNWEFQWYTKDTKNSFTSGGKLHICPTLTSNDDNYLRSALVNLHGHSEGCTNDMDYGCVRQGTHQHVINPVRSAQLRSKNSFSFKYGRVEVSAKMPTGDWLWPAIWLYPKNSVYGNWPMSGEIDIVESRGNRNMIINRKKAGPDQIGSALHFGPTNKIDGYQKAHYMRNARPGRGFNKGFHLYEMEWTPEYIKFKVDGDDLGMTRVDQGFFDRGKFGNHHQNPWRNGGQMAPFDQEFYIIMNLAVGGVNGYFPDNNSAYARRKPWLNSSPNAATDFWNDRESWKRSWNLNQPHDYERCLKVDYVRVYAL